jgi:phage shock protein A
MGELQAATAQQLATLGAALEEPMGRLAERDNLALKERTILLEQLGTVLQTVDQAGTQFSKALDLHTAKAADMATHVAGSAQELSSLAEAFGQSVQLFQASNDKLTESLRHIETSINRSTARSDEQLAYYVAQAREVIDLSISSQQGLFENLRQLQGRQGKAVALATEERE